ncbi:MAG: Amidophosphoribosyltransferase [Candidatus Curtissbacteria bacterium GW2011_GWA2_41_24]|uniref:Amidophosphoribosyltransferase n=1 Tax=Candidatus Curtissbacteria bacterium GW2011_GWA2_41_24 TaxID=1618411 RepID=A0A0G0VRJ6_9BACT|nr:MAG: Amidophosphoribosyltransferase [Candidatus Curtissbacteria bacterium GW2011_GWA2_41_24]
MFKPHGIHLLGLKKISLEFILRTREKQTSNPVAANFKLPDKLRENCGLAGVWAGSKVNVTNIVIEMGKALQHRGQNGGGVAVKPSGRMLKVYKKARAFNEIFRSVNVVEENSLRGEVAIAHLRYPTEGAGRLHCDAQPFYASYKGWELALGHNGNIVDVKSHRKKLSKLGIKTESDSDSEILTWLIAIAPGASWKQKIANALVDVKGAYSLVMVTGDDKLMALRDPWGVRPLVWSQDNGHVFVASETCALDRISIRHSQKLEAGQLLIADENGVSISNYSQAQKPSFCVFEKLYFSHETSSWDGVIGDNRENLGRQLAIEEIERIKEGEIKKEMVKNIDYVVAVPDTARPGAHAFWEVLSKKITKLAPKLSYIRGLVKERYDYAKRTFIEDDPYLRTKHIEKKFFISPSIIGKSIYLVDDTGVRLNTYKILVEHLLKIGVSQIHCRFLAPRFVHPCFLGVNIGSRDELGAVRKDKTGKYQVMSEAEIGKDLKVASLYYLSLKGLAASLNMSVDQLHASHCTGCLDYHNPFDMHLFDPEYQRTPYTKAIFVKKSESKSKKIPLPISAQLPQ